MKWGVIVKRYTDKAVLGWLKEPCSDPPARLIHDTKADAKLSAELASFANEHIFEVKVIKEYLMGDKKTVQCPSIFKGTKRSNGTTFVFCTRHEGHKGDHRGSGKQWNRKGEKVKITLPADAT